MTKSTRTTGALAFSVAGSAGALSVVPARLVIAGYTARDRAAVQAHIDELAHIGVAPPPHVPMFYEVPADLATTQPAISVRRVETSGEVEPVLLRCAGTFFLGVGSDHTDREVEKRDIAESKASAAKPVGREVVPLERAVEVWDDIEVVCRVDGALYQRGPLAAMVQPADLLAELDTLGRPLDDDALMFCGTLPLIDGRFVYGSRYELELNMPDGTSLRHGYVVRHVLEGAV